MAGGKRKLVLFCYLIVLNNFKAVSAASLGEICSTDAECSSMVNTRCHRMYDCQTGVCACKPKYGNRNGDGCEKRLRSYGETCGAGDYCNGEHEECSSGRCRCSYWYEYSPLAKHCKLRTYQLLTQYCGGWYGIECLIPEADGGRCAGRCRCMDGLIGDVTESYITCRAPKWGERCLWWPKCIVEFNTSSISDDASSTAPTCTSNRCTCPASHEHRVVNGYNLCLNKIRTGFVRYGLGENCTHFNECSSLFCVKCPGAATGVCMQAPEVEARSSSTTYGKPSRWMLSMTLVAITVCKMFQH